MASFQFELARPEDDKQLRNLLARNVMSGEISLSFRREPAYFAACQLDGSESQTIVCRELASNRIVGLGSRSVRDRYVDGQVERIGYLSTLRLDQEHRRRGLVARGFRFFKGLDEDIKEPFFRAKYYVTTIADGNAAAEQTLLGGRAGLPHYHRIGTWSTYSLSMRRCRSSPIPGVEVRPARESEIGLVVGYLNTIGAERNLFPKYRIEDFDPQTGTFRGLNRSHLFVAWEKGDIVGTFALWDQSAFKQVVVEGYAPWLRCCRPIYNAWAFWKRDPKLPKPGKVLEHLVGTLLVVRNDRSDVANLLVSKACDAYSKANGRLKTTSVMQPLSGLSGRLSLRESDFALPPGGSSEARAGYDSFCGSPKTPNRLLLGFDARCPLSTKFAASASHVYTTGIYLVSWDPMQWKEYNRDRLIYLELGCL